MLQFRLTKVIGTTWLALSPGFVRTLPGVARELELNGRKFWILSDPDANGWKAKVLEIRDKGEQDEIGIEASGETRTAADAVAERKLRRLLGLP